MERVQELIATIECARSDGMGGAVVMRDALIEVIGVMAAKIDRLTLDLAASKRTIKALGNLSDANSNRLTAHQEEYERMKERVKEYIPRIL